MANSIARAHTGPRPRSSHPPPHLPSSRHRPPRHQSRSRPPPPPPPPRARPMQQQQRPHPAGVTQQQQLGPCVQGGRAGEPAPAPPRHRGPPPLSVGLGPCGQGPCVHCGRAAAPALALPPRRDPPPPPRLLEAALEWAPDSSQSLETEDAPPSRR
eukprot:scaffold79311_cov59-Phaeocystis_antarctica.AAC.3